MNFSAFIDTIILKSEVCRIKIVIDMVFSICMLKRIAFKIRNLTRSAYGIQESNLNFFSRIKLIQN